MPQPILAIVRRSALLRAGVIAVTVSVIIGVASALLPLTCGAGLCHADAGDSAAAALPASAITFPPPATSTRAKSTAVVTTAAAKVPSVALTRDNFIAATFDLLNVTLQAPDSSSEARVASSTPTTRIVKITAVHADGSPMTPDAATVAPAATAETQPAVVEVADTTSAPPSESIAEASATEAHIGAVSVNARSGPSTSSKRLFALAPGVPVTVSASDKGWLKVSDDLGHTGWVYSSFVEGTGSVTAAPSATADDNSYVTAYADPPAAKDTATVKGAGVSVRASAATSGARLFALPGGAKVTVVSKNRGWVQIVDDKGRSGWAYGSYLQM